MDNQTFEKKMRELEYFHSLRLWPGTHTVIAPTGAVFPNLLPPVLISLSTSNSTN